MVSELATWNPSAFAVLQRIFAAAQPFQSTLLGTEISVSVERQSVDEWPEPAPVNLDPSRHGAWPDTLMLRVDWSTGATLLRAKVVCASEKYDGLLVLRVQTRSGQTLLWLNLPSALAKSEDGVAPLRVLTAVVKRGDNSAQSEALLSVTRSAGLPFASGKMVSLCAVRVPSGELTSEPLELWQNLVRFCLLKLPFLSSDPRDIEGRYFIATAPDQEPGGRLEHASETVLGTTHGGLAIPVLRALSLGATDPASVEERVLELHGKQLTPGDYRSRANGAVLWRDNVRWALSHLKQRGEVDNPVRSQWRITQAGRRRLEQELETFDIRPFQTLQAKVVVQGGEPPERTETAPITKSMPPKRTALWHERLAANFDRATLDRLPHAFARISAHPRPRPLHET